MAELEPARQLTRIGSLPVPSGLLRHADEQTVAAVLAVQRVLDQGDLPADFRSWGILGCLHAPGRTVVGASLTRYAEEGAWGVSPHLIPHRCLHSLSGTLSLILKCEGPNFGVGEPEALLPSAVAWLHQRRVPGIWVVASWLQPEYPPEQGFGAVPRNNVAHSLALAMLPDSTSAHDQLIVQPTSAKPVERWDVYRLTAWLSGQHAEPWVLPGGFQIERQGCGPAFAPHAATRARIGLQEVAR